MHQGVPVQYWIYNDMINAHPLHPGWVEHLNPLLSCYHHMHSHLTNLTWPFLYLLADPLGSNSCSGSGTSLCLDQSNRRWFHPWGDPRVPCPPRLLSHLPLSPLLLLLLLQDLHHPQVGAQWGPPVKVQCSYCLVTPHWRGPASPLILHPRSQQSPLTPWAHRLPLLPPLRGRRVALLLKGGGLWEGLLLWCYACPHQGPSLARW